MASPSQFAYNQASPSPSPQNSDSNRMQNEYSDPAFQQFAMNMNLTAYTTAAPVAQYPAMASPYQPTYDQASTSANSVHRRRRSGGGRRMSPDDLIPLDAPTQPRRYLAPSATPKKEVPSYYNKRPSYGRLSDDEQEDELNEEPPAPNATDQEKIEWKRRQNTLAARRSRKRKLLQQQHLEQAVEDLTKEREIWRTRALTLRQLLRSHGILCPDFDNPSTQVQDFDSLNTSAALRVPEQLERLEKPMDEALMISRARSAPDCASAHCQSDTFVARDALGHVNTHRDDILEPLGVQHALTALVLAGFNEDYIREGIGLLQEIHIVTREDLELDGSAIAGVGKACSPFPSVIFMPSGKVFQPPLYDQNGQAVPFSILSGSVCKLRYGTAADKGLSLANSGRILDRHGDTSRHATGGNAPISQEALPTINQLGEVSQPARISQNASSNASTSGEGGEGGTYRAQGSKQGDNDSESPSQGLDLDVLPQGHPEKDKSTPTKRLRNVFLRLLLAIRQSEENSSFGQNIQLQAAFDFQLSPGNSATVEFRELVCSRATASSTQHQPHYSHKYLKVLVDVQSDNWKPIRCLPQRTPAGQREIKDVDTNKSTKQGGIKFKAALTPEANVEGTLTSENAKASERVRFISGITQENWLGEYTWGFDIDDEREQRQGLQLSADRLPNLSLDYLRDARDPSENDIPKELTVEISAFWSLNPPTSNGWLWWQSQCPPQYSNLVHSVRVDLPADMDCDGHFVGEQKIGGGLPESRKVKNLSPLGIVVSTGIQAPGNGAPETFPRWLPRLS